MNLLEKILEYIFLPCCGICNKLGEGHLCQNCEKELDKFLINRIKNIKQLNSKKYKITGEENKKIRLKKIEIMHVFMYKGLLRELILQYKFEDKPYLYKMFCEFILKNKKILKFIKSYDIIVPVPMHIAKKRKRGYNQSELIAKELARKANLIMFNDILIKIKDNKTQSSLTKKQRKENIKNVYDLKNLKKINYKKILIFDDIYTTGATINECIKIIQKANINKIGVLTLAKD